MARWPQWPPGDEMLYETRSPTSNYAIIAAAALSLCLVCSAMAFASQVWMAHNGQQASSSVIALCAWARGGRTGLWWNANIAPARAFANAPRYNAACLAVPWSASLPEQGRPAVDLQP